MAIATYWTAAAAITSRWNSSRKPKVRGQGSGALHRVDDRPERVQKAAEDDERA